MPRVSLPFANGFYLSESLPVSHQEAINCYPNVVQSLALSQDTLFPTPGIVQLVADPGAGDEVNRGAHVMAGVPYFVQGDKLYRLNRSVSASGAESYTFTELGDIEGTGRVWMADNGDQLCVLVPGGKGYIFSETGPYGSDIVTNGDFAIDSDWSKGTGWSIGGGSASCDGTQVTTSKLRQLNAINPGVTVKITFTISNWVSGDLTPLAGATEGSPYSGDGTFTVILDASAGAESPTGSDLQFRASLDFEGDLDDVSAVEETSPFTFEEITDPDFRASGNPQAVVFIDGYFLFTTDDDKHIVSSLNDGTSYNALDFGSAEADPDDIVAPIVFRNQLFIGGKQTMEAFQNIGGADYPFSRTGLFIQKGISAPFATANANNTFLFIGAGENESPAVWALTGNDVAKVSTTAIDQILQGFTAEELASCFAWSYAQSGAYFVGFVLPTTTIVYDTISQRWHERKSYIVDYSEEPQTVRSRVNSVVQAYGHVLVGDSQDGRVGKFDRDVYTEYDEAIVRRFTTPPVFNDTGPFFVPWVELTVESGVGNASSVDPVVTMYQSKDGRTWSDGLRRKMGKIGEYTKRCIWRRLGRVPRFVVYRFDVSDPVKFTAIALHAEVQGED